MSIAKQLITPVFSRSAAHQKRAHEIIPGGAHTYAKGDDQFPAGMCPVIVRGKGAHVFDMDGNEFIEYGAGVRSVTLGHGYGPVCDAAFAAMTGGTNFVRPSVIELKAAEKMLEVIDKADMVKFGKNGSDAVTGAVKIARAYTGRDMVAICGDHPFFSVDDWFMCTTATTSGIPEWNRQQTVKFKYNDLASVQALFDQFPNQIACIVLEAETVELPVPNYLHDLQELCHCNGALMILDETVTGFRWHVGGAQKFYNFTPDLSTFGKGMANGFSVSALCGRREYMRLAGIEHTDRERCFTLSLTHGAETHGLAACIATIEAYQNLNVCNTLARQGTRLKTGLQAAIDQAGVNDYFQIIGRPWLLFYATLDQSKQRSQAFRTLFIQEIMKRGILAPSFAVGAAHLDEDIDRTIEAVGEALEIYKLAIDEGVEKYLVGRPVQPVFRKFN
ncbi:MAG: glutamate-1-semialdehyde 2,1-aminomutase [Burkholderiales bacterium]|nr:glutamate-1-semialdehyde 2,1-aminomutase [Phycisphaerae bacterium]